MACGRKDMLMMVSLLSCGVMWGFCNASTPYWSQTDCGKSKYSDAGDMDLPSGYIVGGQDARPNEFPWQVSLLNRGRHSCGGSIIDNEWVVTAAHCVDRTQLKDLSVVVGEWRRNVPNDARQTIDVSLIKAHERYSSQTLQNDIALLKLSTPITYNDDVMPVCAPDTSTDYTNHKVVASGWGLLTPGGANLPDTLQYVLLNVTSDAYCKNAYGSGAISSDMVCTTDNAGDRERDSCQIDSGGPLTTKEADGTFSLVGVVSWGIGCASGYPGVYARVTYFNDWITNFINNN